jgi:hypothetical protein
VWPRPEQAIAEKDANFRQQFSEIQCPLLGAVPTACQQCTNHGSTLGAPHTKGQSRSLLNKHEEWLLAGARPDQEIQRPSA